MNRNFAWRVQFRTPTSVWGLRAPRSPKGPEHRLPRTKHRTDRTNQQIASGSPQSVRTYGAVRSVGEKPTLAILQPHNTSITHCYTTHRPSQIPTVNTHPEPPPVIATNPFCLFVYSRYKSLPTLCYSSLFCASVLWTCQLCLFACLTDSSLSRHLPDRSSTNWFFYYC